MLGPGRPAKRPTIEAVRELTREEVASVPRARAPTVVRLRDTHHMIARLFAMGLRPRDIAMRTGYSLSRVSILSGDPAFQELVAAYRESVDESWREQADEYFESATAVRVTSMRLIRDRLEEAEPGDIPLNQLVAIHADTADRTGYPKRKESVNLNVDFAARLEQAVRRSTEAKLINGTTVPDPGPTSSSAPGSDPPPDGAVGSTAAAEGKSLDTPNPPPSRLAKYLPQPTRADDRRFG